MRREQCVPLGRRRARGYDARGGGDRAGFPAHRHAVGEGRQRGEGNEAREESGGSSGGGVVESEEGPEVVVRVEMFVFSRFARRGVRRSSGQAGLQQLLAVEEGGCCGYRIQCAEVRCGRVRLHRMMWLRGSWILEGRNGGGVVLLVFPETSKSAADLEVAPFSPLLLLVANPLRAGNKKVSSGSKVRSCGRQQREAQRNPRKAGKISANSNRGKVPFTRDQPFRRCRGCLL